MMSETVYLVVEPMAIIGRDLAMNVQDYDPSARILVATSLDAAFDMLVDAAPVRLAFVHVDPDLFSPTNLALVLHNHGAQVVFIGNAAEQNDRGILVLHRPFSAQTTAALLQRAQIAQRA